MSKTNIKPTPNKEAQEYLARKLRSQEEQLKSPTKKMIINTSSLDENGKSIKQHVGTFHIVGTDLYSETIKFRPLASLNKLIKMTKGKTKEGADKWNYVNQTVLFSNYNDTIYDAKGGIACGKIFGNERTRMTKEQQEANNEKAKSYTYLFGLAQFPSSKEWHFVDFRVGGKRIIEISDALSFKNLGKGKFMSQYIFDMECIAQSTSVHPELHMSIDEQAGLQDVSDIIEYDNLISNYVEAHNEQIMKQFKKYSAQASSVQSDEDDDLNDDLSDLDIGDKE